jgi:hypothetical protein
MLVKKFVAVLFERLLALFLGFGAAEFRTVVICFDRCAFSFHALLELLQIDQVAHCGLLITSWRDLRPRNGLRRLNKSSRHSNEVDTAFIAVAGE